MTTRGAAQLLSPDWDHNQVPGADGNSIHYVSSGSVGPPVVLLHGWPGFWYDWRHVIGPLANHCRVIAVDLRGFGASVLPDGRAADVSGEANLGRDVLSVLDHLGIEKAILGGFDVGAAVAQWIARNHASRAAGMVLVNPTYPGIGTRRDEVSLKGEFWYQQLHLLPWAAELVAHDRQTVAVYLAHFYSHWAADPGAVRMNELEVVIDSYARPGSFEASIAWYRAREHDRAVLASAPPDSLLVRQPTTILWADRDPVAPPNWADGIEAYFTDMSLQEVSDVGHFLVWERPTAFVDATTELLRRC